MWIQLQEPYRARAVRFLEHWETDGWRLKMYGIAYQTEFPSADLLHRAKDLAVDQLPVSGGPNYGVGFIGVHEGRGSNFIFVDWWQDENELHHHVYVAMHTQPEHFTYMTPTGLTACVWDLSVMGFERQALIDHVLAKWEAPDVEGYLRCHMNQDL